MQVDRVNQKYEKLNDRMQNEIEERIDEKRDLDE